MVLRGIYSHQWYMIAMVTTFLLNDLWKPWLQKLSSVIYDNHGYKMYPQWYMTTMVTTFIYPQWYMKTMVCQFIFLNDIWQPWLQSLFILNENMHMSQLWQGVGTSKVCKTAQQQNKQQKTKHIYCCTQPGVFFLKTSINVMYSSVCKISGK